jgi:hypothetical protein
LEAPRGITAKSVATADNSAGLGPDIDSTPCQVRRSWVHRMARPADAKTDLRASQTGLGADGAQRSLAMGGGGPRADADSMRRSTQWQKKARCSGRSSRI